MSLLPFNRMWERIDRAREDSETTLFYDLLYFGEMVTKIVTAGLVAAIEDDRQRHRYRQLHCLVRADGLGDWTNVINDVLTGPASQHLMEAARSEQRELTQRLGRGTWQYDSAELLATSLKEIGVAFEDVQAKTDGRKWFSLFVTLRNSTRGHGAPTSGTCGKICFGLEESIRLVTENLGLFKRSWAFLHRTLSGKYHVTKLGYDSTPFDHLKTQQGRQHNFVDGVYVAYEKQLVRVDLIESDVDATDFYFPNGAFNNKRFELLSYITGIRADGDAAPYLIPATELPSSETQGIGTLDLQGNSFGNLPPTQIGYIHRSALETELFTVLKDENHPIVTLVGRGGIGKTWLALATLHQIAKTTSRFAAILWFSARDIDLLPEGPKIVTPHVLTVRDIAEEFIRLVRSSGELDKGSKAITYLAQELSKSSIGPLLFVFDNFETVRNPVELYAWLDTYVRNPNKVLITTRFRDFKADYPVEVTGMTEAESEELIDSSAIHLGIKSLLNDEYRKEVYQESDGHPYVIKILLGEVAKAGKLVRVERIVAAKEEILDALFERTYAGLSPVAKRVFLTLCSWRSTIPQLALEAVLLRPSNEKMDVIAAIDELNRSSFIEVTESKEDNQLFVTVPLAASVFGRRKLAVSPMKSAIESDLQLLYAFGAAQESGIKHGIRPRIEELFRHIADRISSGKDKLDDHVPMLEFIARKYPPAWLLLARLHEDAAVSDDLSKAKESVRRYLEVTPKDAVQQDGWQRLAILCKRTGDWTGEIHALVEMCQLPDIPFSTISNVANRANALFSQKRLALDTVEKQMVSRHLIEVMESHIADGDATDLSRLAWLCLRLQDQERARRYTDLGLGKEPNNEHLLNLKRKLGS